MPRLKLFCFPYAGGSSVVFNKWKKYLDDNIELIPVELAGRGKRFDDPLYKDVKGAVDDVFDIVSKEITDTPYALFGHSMGAMIVYHLAKKINNTALARPKHIFFSGRSAPHLIRPDRKKFHLMNDDDFKKEVIALGGTPPEFFEHQELLELFLRFLKNDFRLAETDDYHGEEIKPFDEEITVFLGKEDELTAEQCDGWKIHTSQICNIHHFKGGHFFLNDETERLVTVVNTILA